MRKYSDYQKDNKPGVTLTETEFKNVKWTKFKIVVTSEDDKNELMEACKYFHDQMIDTDLIAVNQLAHMYTEGSESMYIIDPKLYELL